LKEVSKSKRSLEEVFILFSFINSLTPSKLTQIPWNIRFCLKKCSWFKYFVWKYCFCSFRSNF